MQGIGISSMNGRRFLLALLSAFVAPFQEVHSCPLLSRFIRCRDDYRKPRSPSAHCIPISLPLPLSLSLSFPLSLSLREILSSPLIFSRRVFHLLVFRVRFRAMAFTDVFCPVSSRLTTFFRLIQSIELSGARATFHRYTGQREI